MERHGSLGQSYPMEELSEQSSTKERIIMESVALFTQYGYHGVSIKDIANAVGIKPASIYNHFVGKEEIWNAILERVHTMYIEFFERLEQAKATAFTFADVLDNMFLELKNVTSMFVYYGLGMVQSEQFHSERVAELLHEVFMKYSMSFIQRQFEECIQEGLVEPFDTGAVAMLFMSSILVHNNLRIQENLGRELPVDLDRAYIDIENFILQAVGAEKKELTSTAAP